MTMPKGFPLGPDTPWTRLEQYLARLDKIDKDLSAIATALGAPAGGSSTTVNVPPGIQSILASQVDPDFPLKSVVSPSVSILSRLMANFEDYGVVTKLSTISTTLQDTKKFWEPHIFTNHTLYILIGSFLYNSIIEDNDNQNLYFDALANQAQPDIGCVYWIEPTTLPSGWVNQPAVVLYGAPSTPYAISTFYSAWFDFSNSKRGMCQFVSTLDQAVNVQLVGNGIQDYPTARNMGAPQNIAAGNVNVAAIDIGIGINDDWHPYLGVVFKTLVAPTVGNLTITMYSQK